MRAVASVFFLSAILSAPAYAAQTPTEQKIAVCATIKGDLARLQCFDNLAESLHLNKPQPVGTAGAKGSKTGKWQVTNEKNPIDDSVTAYAVIHSDSGTSRFGRPVGLILRCQQSKTEAYIDWGSFLGEDVSVLTRIGSAEATTSRWGLSSDKTASFYPGDATDFIKQLMEADSFVAQVTPYDESPVTAIFDIHGVKDAVQPIRDACKW